MDMKDNVLPEFSLSNRSRFRLTGVHPDLVRVIERAIELTKVDFTVVEGLRTEDRQRQLVAAGASKTMKSRHLIGQAVDIAPVVAGQVRWDWPLVYRIAQAVREAAIELKVTVTWGGVWDRPINDLSDDLADEVRQYCVRHSGSDFLDGPHFQIEPAKPKSK